MNKRFKSGLVIGSALLAIVFGSLSVAKEWRVTNLQATDGTEVSRTLTITGSDVKGGGTSFTTNGCTFQMKNVGHSSGPECISFGFYSQTTVDEGISLTAPSSLKGYKTLLFNYFQDNSAISVNVALYSPTNTEAGSFTVTNNHGVYTFTDYSALTIDHFVISASSTSTFAAVLLSSIVVGYSCVPSATDPHVVSSADFALIPNASNFQANVKYYFSFYSGVGLEQNITVSGSTAYTLAQSYTSYVKPTKQTFYWWIDSEGCHTYAAAVSTGAGNGTEESPYVQKGVIVTSATNVIDVEKISYLDDSGVTTDSAPRVFVTSFGKALASTDFAYSNFTYDSVTGTYSLSYSYVQTGSSETVNATLSLLFTNNALEKLINVHYLGTANEVKREIVYSNYGTNSVTVPDTVKAVADNTAMSS
jgi:hypothetical protein